VSDRARVRNVPTDDVCRHAAKSSVAGFGRGRGDAVDRALLSAALALRQMDGGRRPRRVVLAGILVEDRDVPDRRNLVRSLAGFPTSGSAPACEGSRGSRDMDGVVDAADLDDFGENRSSELRRNGTPQLRVVRLA